MDPNLVERWMQRGQASEHLDALPQRAACGRSTTTHSPESPTAWASFATGVNPGKHNIYDFLVRDTSTYLPDLGMVRREPAKFLFDYIPARQAEARSRFAAARPSGSRPGQAGVRSSILTVPVTFPPEEVPNGELLSGLPLPDIRGTMGTFYYFATDLSRYEEGNTEFGGILKRLSSSRTSPAPSSSGRPTRSSGSRSRRFARSRRRSSDADRAAIAGLRRRKTSGCR